MHVLYLLSVLFHLLAAITWIGGMLFLVLVVVPWLRRGDRASAAKFLRETGPKFRDVGWACFAVLLVTGTFQLYVRGVRFENFVDPRFLGSDFGVAVLAKLGFFLLVLIISAVHDFHFGPRAAEEVVRDPHGPEAERLRRAASLLGRGNALLALALVVTAVTLVRGCP